MGLDMYLYKKTFVNAGDNKIVLSKNGKKLKGIKPERVRSITEEVGYWRKANQIHNWFVEKVQNGDDDGGTYNVGREQLQELLDTVNKVLESSKLTDGKVKNGEKYNPETQKFEDIMGDGQYIEDPSVAKELLPTQEGFFFGSTDYDQYYIEDLKHTKKMLEELLAEDENVWADYSYTASW